MPTLTRKLATEFIFASQVMGVVAKLICSGGNALIVAAARPKIRYALSEIRRARPEIRRAAPAKGLPANDSQVHPCPFFREKLPGKG